MRIYNTLSRRKEEFKPLEEGKVKMYVCGPTVYNLIHIGNARPMIVFDTVRRYLEYKGYDVNYVSNFTDVDDKIIKKANEEGVSAEEISTRYIAECKKDMEGMNIKPATTHPLATQEIGGMIDMIQTLIDKGYAMELYTTEQESSQNTESYLRRILTTWRQDTEMRHTALRLQVRMRRKTHLISFSGSLRKKESHLGHHLGAMEDRVGILNALLCLRSTLLTKSISMQVDRI